MSVRGYLTVLGAFIITLGVAPVTPSARGQVAQVTVSSLGELLTQCRTLASSVDAESAKLLVAALGALDKGGALKPLDRTRPLSAVLELIPSPLAGPTGFPVFTLFMPVKPQGDLLEALKALGATVEKNPGVAGFTHKVVLGNKKIPPAFLLESPPAGYAVLTTAPVSPAVLRAVNPARLKPARPGVLFACIRIDRIPEAAKRKTLDGAKAKNDASLGREEGESDRVYDARIAGARFAETLSESLFRDGRALSLDVNVDAKRGQLALGLGLEAKPGSPMANAFAYMVPRRSRLQSLSHGAAMSLAGVVPLSETAHGVLHQGVESLRDIAEEAKSANGRAAIHYLIDAIEPNLMGPAIETCVTVGAPAAQGGSPGKAGSAVILAAMSLKDSRIVEEALRKAVAKAATPTDLRLIALDHDRCVDGTMIHRFARGPKPTNASPSGFDRNVLPVIGEPVFFLAFPEGAGIMALGGDGSFAIKQAVATLRRPTPAPAVAAGSQISLDAATKRLAELPLGGNPDAYQQSARSAFPGAAADRDRVRLSLSGGPDRARLTLDADLPVLRFLAEFAIRANAAKAGQRPATSEAVASSRK
jgi:hypothetical protein